MSLLRIQIKNQYKKTLSNPDNTNLLYSNSTNRKETPLCASTTASMTIEAAIALPLFVICILSVIFLFRVLELQQDVEYALQYAARKSAIHAHMTHESGLDSVVPIAEAKILFQRKLEELKAPVIYVEGEEKGFSFWRSELMILIYVYLIGLKIHCSYWDYFLMTWISGQKCINGLVIQAVEMKMELMSILQRQGNPITGFRTVPIWI